MSATVLITGAGGFVGSAIVRRLVDAALRSAVSFHDGDTIGTVVALLRPGASAERLEALPPRGIAAVDYCDITDGPELSAVLARWQPRAVLHVALDRSAYADESPSGRQHFIEAPLERIFAGLAGTPGARVVHTSSAWVLPSGDRLDERTPLHPVTPYGRNKVHAERLLPILQAETGIDWINLRLFNIFGRYEPHWRLLPYLVDRLSRRQVATLANADGVRDFTDVDVIADAYIAALAVGTSGCGATYHIGSGRGITIREFAMTVAEVIGDAESIHVGNIATADGSLPRQVANVALARQVLGWSAVEDPRAHIRAAARWWLQRANAEGRPAGARRVPELVDGAN